MASPEGVEVSQWGETIFLAAKTSDWLKGAGPLGEGPAQDTSVTLESEPMNSTRPKPKTQLAIADAIRLYLDPLTPNSRRRQEKALTRLAKLMSFPHTSDDCWSCQWHQIPVTAYATLHRTMGEQYSANTANADRAAVRKVLSTARKLGLMDAFEAELAIEVMSAFKGTRVPRRQYLEPEEAAAMFAACDLDDPSEARDACLLALLYAGAMRGGEGRGIALEDVNFTANTVLVTGKGNRQRHVQLTSGSMRMVRAWLVHRGMDPGSLLAAVDRWGKVHIRHVDGSTVWRWVKRTYKRAGLEHLCPHDLRAASITRLIEHGDVHQAQLHAGHSSPVTTKEYDRTADRRLRSTLDSIDFIGE